MASRRFVAPSSLEQTSADSKSSKAGNENKASIGARKKTKPGGIMVKSRYLQPVEKTSLSKSNSLTNKSVTVPPRPSSPKAPGDVRPQVATPPRCSMVPQAPPTRVATPPRRSMAPLAPPARVATPPRRSMAPQAPPARVATPPRRSMAPPAFLTSTMSRLLEPSLLGRSILQSTFSDGNYYSPPEFDLSAIKENTVMQNPGEPERSSENEKMIIEHETFLLAYLTAKIQSNTANLKAAAEARMLEVMEEEEKLRKENQEKQRQHLLMERDRRTKELLDLQIAVLTPVAEAAEQFTAEYRTLATAVDTTRHELPVKNLYIEADRRAFLDKAEACLKETEKVLVESTQDSQQDHSTSADCLRDMTMASKDISQELAGGFSELLDLSSLVSCQSVLIQQALEEDRMGLARAQELYCPTK